MVKERIALVLYWPQYKAQLMLQSPTEADTCDERKTKKKQKSGLIKALVPMMRKECKHASSALRHASQYEDKAGLKGLYQPL